MSEHVAWLSLALLGAFHGLNPGMGWLFAVALGLQEGSRAAVVRAFGPIAVGHALAIVVVVLLVGGAQLVVAPETLRYVAAIGLVTFGLVKLLGRGTHPRWVGMRVTPRELAGWSFLMATAHGAGLMLVPIVSYLSPGAGPHAAHMAHAAAQSTAVESTGMLTTTTSLPITELMAVGVHTVAMFVVMAALALLVFDRLGLAILRRAWLNVDRLWAGALVVVGALTFVV
ncbi:MAG: hypothetical protein IT305_11905 [Chloroflexi bacterium]|nr:hypothetical protein [Chloroflexota bacterium]